MNHTYTPILSPKATSDAISQIGLKKATTQIWQLMLLGALAGLYIGFGGQLFLVALATGLGKVAGGFFFSVGLILVVVAGAELFTGNITILVGVLYGDVSGGDMFKNWTTVYVANFIGSVVLAWLIYQSGLLGSVGKLSALGALSAKVAAAKVSLPFMQAFIRGVFCNILVVLAVIMAIMAKDGVSKIFCILFPIGCFVACGFEHCVANMYLITLGFLAKGASFAEMMTMFHNQIPVTLGNIVGGIFIVTVHPTRIQKLSELFTKNQEELRG